MEMARLKEFYKKDVVNMMMKRFNYSSVMEVPRVTKITLNMGVGEAVGDKKVMNHVRIYNCIVILNLTLLNKFLLKISVIY